MVSQLKWWRNLSLETALNTDLKTDRQARSRQRGAAFGAQPAWAKAA